MEAPIPVIAQSVMQLFASRDDKRSWAKAIVAMRHGFGGHPFGPDAAVVEERRDGRVGDIYRPKTQIPHSPSGFGGNVRPLHNTPSPLRHRRMFGTRTPGCELITASRLPHSR